MKKVIGLSVVLVIVQVAHAADIEAGKEMAATVCAACHGANGVSVSDNIPNLAAQRTGYLEAQLKAFKDGTRKQPGATSPTAIMSAIATQLSAENIANVAAYFASQPGAAAGAKSALLPNVANAGVTFPEGYKDSFTKYHTINFPVTKQVRYYYANSPRWPQRRRESRCPTARCCSPKCTRRNSTPTTSRSLAATASTWQTNCSYTRLWRGKRAGAKTFPRSCGTRTGTTQFLLPTSNTGRV